MTPAVMDRGAFARTVPGPPAGWVFRVAVNWATPWRRKWRRRPVRPVEELDGAHRNALPDDEVVQLLARSPVRSSTLVDRGKQVLVR